MRLIRKLNKMVYNTEQRNLLLSFLKDNPDKKFSAKEIEKALAHENISRSAVYRNLADLEADGKVKRYSKTGSRETFFQYYDLQCCRNHIHLSCIKCGKIFHLENQIADNLVNNLADQEGFEINKGETTLYGICKDCKEFGE